MGQVIIFNGPPGSGKDEACRFLVSQHGFKHLSFKHQLFVETIKHYGVDNDWFMNGYEDRTTKEQPEELLGGRSRREALIHVSEDVLKPTRGKGIFGEQAAKQINGIDNYCFSDGGFTEEIVPIINTIGAENLCVVQLLRDGSSFDNDSRRYINGELHDEYVLGHSTPLNLNHILPDRFDGVTFFRVHNNGRLAEFHQIVKSIYLRGENVPTKKRASLSRES
jgi:hypothetical protein